MPIILKRPDGTISRYRNCELIPAYLLIPKELLVTASAKIRDLPRIIASYFYDKDVMDIVETDLFFERVSNVYSYMVWNYLNRGANSLHYSNTDPGWILSYKIDIWVSPLIQHKVIPDVHELTKYAETPEVVGYTSMEIFERLIAWSVEQAMQQYDIQKIIELIKEYPCAEDFSVFDSHAKTDFIRKWYHTRTKHPQISLEEFQENYAKNNNGKEWDTVDESIDFEKELTEKATVESFLETLTEKDKAILNMRMDGYTLEEIADELGYANHSGVLKRIRKIGQAYEKYTDVDFGFSEKKIV